VAGGCDVSPFPSGRHRSLGGEHVGPVSCRALRFMCRDGVAMFDPIVIPQVHKSFTAAVKFDRETDSLRVFLSNLVPKAVLGPRL